MFKWRVYLYLRHIGAPQTLETRMSLDIVMPYIPFSRLGLTGLPFSDTEPLKITSVEWDHDQQLFIMDVKDWHIPYAEQERVEMWYKEHGWKIDP